MEKLVNIITKECNKVNPSSVEDYIKFGGFEALKKALEMTPKEICTEVKDSLLKGRGGAGYPTGVKWEQASEVKENPKYILCNGDEGEPGTFKDKVIFEKIPMKLIEGMTIAAKVLNAREGYIYIRGEYAAIQRIVKEAIENAKEAGYLGENILNSGFSFDLKVLTGAGGYVVGENSALVESSEGKAGRPRMKPPYIKVCGLYKKPTLVNNVETFASIPYIVKEGGRKYAELGTSFSGGTKLVCLSGSLNNRGVYEVPFGVTLREIIYDIGGGIPDGKKLKAVQIGGSSGAVIPESMLDIPLCYNEFKKHDISIGSGAILVLDNEISIIEFLKHIYKFFVHESCGKCTPCREGNKNIIDIIEKFSNKEADKKDFEKLDRLIKTMNCASFCGLGRTASMALKCCLEHFREEFEWGLEY